MQKGVISEFRAFTQLDTRMHLKQGLDGWKRRRILSEDVKMSGTHDYSYSPIVIGNSTPLVNAKTIMTARYVGNISWK